MLQLQVSTQINLSWIANPPLDGVANYNVYRGTTLGFPVTPGTTPPIATPTTNSYSNTGLTASTTYYYKVAAVDAAGNIGPLSSEVSATTSVTDTIRPTVAVTSPTPNQSVSSGTVVIQGTASDNAGGSGVRDVYTRLDAGGYLSLHHKRQVTGLLGPGPIISQQQANILYLQELQIMQVMFSGLRRYHLQ